MLIVRELISHLNKQGCINGFLVGSDTIQIQVNNGEMIILKIIQGGNINENV